MKRTTLDHLIGAPQAALQAGVSRERLIRLLQRGGLRGAFLAGRWLVDKNDLHEFISREAEQHDEPAGTA